MCNKIRNCLKICLIKNVLGFAVICDFGNVVIIIDNTVVPNQITCTQYGVWSRALHVRPLSATCRA